MEAGSDVFVMFILEPEYTNPTKMGGFYRCVNQWGVAFQFSLQRMSTKEMKATMWRSSMVANIPVNCGDRRFTLG